jgi:hypothetical protein
MNIFQRIVLVLGAIALVLAILTTPQSVILQGTYATPTPMLNELTQIDLQPMITPATAIMRSIGVVGATILLVFALQGITIKRRAKKSKPKK